MNNISFDKDILDIKKSGFAITTLSVGSYEKQTLKGNQNPHIKLLL